MAKPLKIDQALHGYQDGHRLLACSAVLPAEAERAMLPLTDGPDRYVSIPEGGYLTGYPVVGLEGFALARTWPAPEMPRPGCVWTHSLLIRRDDLAKFESPRALLSLFRRPESGRPAREPYRARLSVSANLASHTELEMKFGADWLESLVYHLYAQSRPVVFRSEPDLPRDALLIAVWGQQWPALRSSFSFASIATTRKPAGRDFDLRVAPVGVDGVMSRALAGAEVISSEPTAQRERFEPWVGAVQSDLRRPGRLRRVLWRYGRETSERTAFRALVEVYLAVESAEADEKRLSRVLELLRTSFPKQKEMRTLKQDLLGPGSADDGASDALALGVGEEEVLLALVRQPDVGSLSPDYLSIPSRAQDLWFKDRVAALTVLEAAAKSPEAPFARSCLRGLLPLAMEAPAELVRHAPAAVPLALTEDPQLAANPAIWTGRSKDLEDRLKALGPLGPMGRARHQVVRALLRADSRSLTELAASLLGGGLAADVLELAGERKMPSLSEEWVQLLQRDPSTVAAWYGRHADAGLSDEQLLLVAESAEPADVADFGASKQWQRLVERLGDDGLLRLSGRQLAFMFCLGLRLKGQAAARVLAGTFKPLRRALDVHPAHPAEELLAREIPVAPRHHAIHRTSDALARRWRDEGWSIMDLVDAVDDSTLMGEVLASLVNTKKGTRFVNDFLGKHKKRERAVVVDLLPSDWENLASRR